MKMDKPKDIFTPATLATIKQFNDAFNRQDIETVMAAMTDDCIFENTYPPPDGNRYEGQENVRAAFEAFFQSSPRARFEIEEIFAVRDRCIVRWVYYWQNEAGQLGHIRGVDLFRLRDGKITEKLSYVKG
jgi:ketosteroid isomerase-like protein